MQDNQTTWRSSTEQIHLHYVHLIKKNETSHYVRVSMRQFSSSWERCESHLSLSKTTEISVPVSHHCDWIEAAHLYDALH